MTNIDEKKVVELCNAFLEVMNAKKPTYLELIAFCAQMLIRSGVGMSNGKYSLSTINWKELEESYYGSKEKNISLATILVGGNIMSIINEFEGEDIVNAKKEISID